MPNNLLTLVIFNQGVEVEMRPKANLSNVQDRVALEELTWR